MPLAKYPDVKYHFSDPNHRVIVIITLLQLLHPFAPHITEEMWERLGGPPFILESAWPVADPELMKEDIATIVIQVNGKLRGQVEAEPDAPQASIEAAARALDGVKPHLDGKTVAKVVFVPGRLINFVVR